MPIFEVEIRGAKYQIDAPDEATAATQSLKLSQQPQHFELGQAPGDDPSKLPAGYDPATGVVAGGAIDDNMGKEVGVGIRQALEGIPGMGGDLYNLMVAGTKKLASGLPPFIQGHLAEELDGKNWLPTSQDVQTVTDPFMGEAPPSLTTKGEVARTVGNFGLGLLGPGGPVSKVGQVLLPAAGTEAGGWLAEGSAFEPYAKLLGGLLGGALSVPKVGGKPIVEAAKDLGVRTKDLTRVVKRMQQDGMTPAQIQTRLGELGDNATLMDVGTNLRQEGQRIVAKGGSGRGAIDDVLTPRDKGANARIRSDLDANLGPAPVPSRVDAGLRRAQKSLSPEYERVLANTKPVNTPAIVDEIDAAMLNTVGEANTKLKTIRNYLNIEGTNSLDPHPRKALAVRQAIDDMLEGADVGGNTRRILTGIRSKVDAELASAAPGIKELDAKFANLAKQRTAVERGQTVLDSGRTSPRPTELADEIAKGGPVIKGRLSQGARAEIDRIVGTNANDRVALQRIIKGEGDWNRDKLGQLFGQDKADRMIAVLDRESTFADTSNRVMKNSATAERLPDGADSFGMLPSWKSGGILGLARAAASDIGERVLDKIRTSSAEARDSGVARIISDTDRNRVVTALIKANGGKRLPQDQIDAAMRALIMTPGVAASGRDR